jgi:hypothetical protein
VGFSIVDTAPSCVHSGISPDDGTVAPYADCLNGFYTFGPGGALNADDPQTSAFWLGASNGTIILTIIGFILFLIVMVAWVKTEDTKLMNQAMRLRGSETPPAPEMQ